MYFKLFIAASLLAALCASAAHAAGDTEEVYSYYLLSCGSYISHRTQPKPENAAADAYYVAGWISAYNKISAKSTTLGTDTDLDSIMLWLESYCHDHPLSDVSGALAQLASETKSEAPAPPIPVPVPASAAPATQPSPKTGPASTFPEVRVK